MAALVIADTSVLIALTAIGRQALLERFLRNRIPPAVEREAKPGLPRLRPGSKPVSCEGPWRLECARLPSPGERMSPRKGWVRAGSDGGWREQRLTLGATGSVSSAPRGTRGRSGRLDELEVGVPRPPQDVDLAQTPLSASPTLVAGALFQGISALGDGRGEVRASALRSR